MSLFHEVTRLRVAAALRRQGHSVLDARELSHSLTAATIEAAVPPEAVGAIGDGTILQKLIDFLNSPAGKALIDALIQLLIHSI